MMDSDELEEVLDEVSDIVDEASQIAHSYFRQTILIENKADNTPVTIADKKTEEAIRNALMKAFPDHGIIGEEFGNHKEDQDYVWTVDPIDGTRSFIRGIPLFGTLVGLMHKREPVLGIMVLPALDELYVAAKGIGTYCNGVQVHSSATKVVENAMLACGDLTAWDSSGQRKMYDEVVKKAELVRGYTDCFGHSLVIRGAIDAMLDPIVSPWDVVPIACLVEEAGGTYFNFEGEKTCLDKTFITSNAHLKSQIIS